MPEEEFEGLQEDQANGTLYLKELTSGLIKGDSFGEITVDILEKSGRRVKISGQENIPRDKPFIAAINHYVRVEDSSNMTGSQKMNDLMSSMGAVVRVVKESGHEGRVIWTPSEVPRPEALLPAFTRDKSISTFLDWLANDSKFMAANISRKVFLKFLANSGDILSVPYSMEGMKEFLEKVKERLGQGDVLALFPEGEVSQELRQAKNGVSHIAISTQSMVLPIAQYDEGGKLVVKIGQPLVPPQERSDKGSFTNQIMGSIATMLPENLRGYYKDKGV